MATLPYVTATGNIEKALNAIKSAATPESVSQDFVKTVLGIKGGSGNQMTAYLKKVGFASSDGTPTDLYKKFRNSATEGWAAAQALKTGYAPLFVRNEYVHKLGDAELKGLVVEETGAEDDANSVALICSSIKQLKKFARWDDRVVDRKAEGASEHVAAEQRVPAKQDVAHLGQGAGIGLNLGYAINLNLPATSDPAVFNAIFKSLKEHLLRGGHD